MIPYSVSEGEASGMAVMAQIRPPHSRPTQTRPDPSEPPLAAPDLFRFPNPRACTLSRWVGLVPKGKRKQASYRPVPSHSRTHHVTPHPALPFRSKPPFPHAEIPCLVVARGPSSRHGETKTDNTDLAIPVQNTPRLAKPDQTNPLRTKPIFPHRFAHTLPSWWGQVPHGKPRGATVRKSGPHLTEPIQR